MKKYFVFIFCWCIFFISSFYGRNGKTMAQNNFKSQNSEFKDSKQTSTQKVEFVLDKTLKGHSAGVQNIRFSPDGKWIASASLDRTIIIWDVETGILRHRLYAHTASVHEVTFNKKGNLLASASEDGTVCLWDSRYGTLLQTYKNKPLLLSDGLILRSVSFVVFSPNSNYLYFGGDNGYIMRVRIDIPNQIPMQVFSINEDTDLLSNTITGGTIASSEKELIFSVDHYVYAISLQNHSLVRRFYYPDEDINDVVIGASKNQITGWAFDGNLVSWDYFSTKKIGTLKVSPKENYSAASYSYDGKYIATGANGTIATIWNAQTKEKIALLSAQKKIVRVCRFSPIENKVATASYDGKIYIWKEKTEEQLQKEIEEQQKIKKQQLEKQEEQILATTSTTQNQDINSNKTACDTVFIDRIVEKIVEKPIYINSKITENQKDTTSNLNSESKLIAIVPEKIIYIRDTVYIRDTIYQKVFVRLDKQGKIKEVTKKDTVTSKNTENIKNTFEDKSENKEYNKEENKNTLNQLSQTEEESEFDKQFIVGKTLNLQNIQFEQGTSKLIGNAYQDLEKLLSILQKHPTMKISLGGHTDNVGYNTINLRLSGERVQTVQNYLVAHGIARSRIQVRAFGGKYPIASNESEETRKLNRRVEVTILSK